MATPVPAGIATPHKRGGHAKALVLALLALLCLTSLSWGLAHVPLGPWQTAVALAIAMVKACTVGLVFMELHTSGLVPRFIAVLTFLFIALLCGGVLGDSFLR